jgi:hypothetical protein
MRDYDKDQRFHEEWLGLAQPYEGLVFSTPVLADAQITPHTDPSLTARFRALLATTPDPTSRSRAPIPAEPIQIPDLEALLKKFLGYDRPGALLPRSALPDSLRFYAEEGRQEIRPTYAIARTPGPTEPSAEDDLFAGFGDRSSSSSNSETKEDPEHKDPYLALIWDLTAEGAPIGTSLDRAEEFTGPWRDSPTNKFDRLLRHTQIPIGLIFSGTELRLVYAPSSESTSHLTFRFKHMAEAAGRDLLAAFELLLAARRSYGAAAEHTLEGLLRESRRRQADVTQELAAQVSEAVEILLDGFENAALRDQAPDRIDWLRAALDAPRDHLYRGVLSVILRLVFVLYSEDQTLLPVGHRFYAEHLSVQGLFQDLVTDAGMHPESMRSRFGAYGRLLVLFRAIFLGVRHKDLVLPPRKGRLFDPSSFPFLEGGLPGSSAPITMPEARAELRPPPIDDGVIYDVLSRLILFKGQRLSYRTLDVEQIGSVYESLMGFHVLRVAAPAVRLGRAGVWVESSALRQLRPADRHKWLADDCQLSAAQIAKIEALVAEHPTDAALAEALEAFATGNKRDRERHRVGAGRLVLQPGDERRRSGSHYTPRSLTERIVRRTLEPLLKCLGHTPTPEQILSLKICDPAMGSGAFLVETCRHLADHLVQAWTRTGVIEALTERHGNAHLHARRLIAQRCLYGVDKNDAAVELAKLSLWLVTMSRELPFTFVDHALRHGDSLVGLDLDQIAQFHWQKGTQIPLFTPLIKDALEQALCHRQEIHDRAEHEDNQNQQEKRRLLDHAEHATSKIRMIADLCVGAFFQKTKDKAREEERIRRQHLIERWIGGDDKLEPELRGLSDEIREAHAPFHWWLEFPEVFFQERPDPLDFLKVNGAAYMEGFVGNPPFMGQARLSGELGASYRDWLFMIHPGSGGKADLAAHFFRRAACLLGSHGALGLVATNTIAQGDTRESGLAHLVRTGWAIYDATNSLAWSGAAAVTVSVVHVASNSIRRGVSTQLDGRAVTNIDSSLKAASERPTPSSFAANRNLSFLGCKIGGQGFVLSPDEATSLIGKNPENTRIVRPYIGGEEVNSDPQQRSRRYVIDFAALDLDDAATYPELLRIVREQVKPYRDGVQRESWKKRWWQFAEVYPSMRAAIADVSHCLVTCQVTKHLVFSFQPTDRVFAHTLYVFPLESDTPFAVLQSRVHEPWARLLSSSLEDRLRYAASDCFDTFPFPRPDPREQIPELEQAGSDFYKTRARYMVATDQGLTKTYNALKDPANTDPAILELRRLTEAMDRAVLGAYGWTDLYLKNDLPPYCPRTPAEQSALQAFQDEIIDRLYQLNAERATAEAASQPPKTKKAKKPKPPTPQGDLF